MLMPSSLRLFVCRQPADMRKSFDGLSNLCREHLQEDPDLPLFFGPLIL